MKAARIRASSPGGTPYSASNAAPSSAIEIHSDVPKPSPSKPGELVIQVRASTVYRDNLTWPEMYPPHHAQLGIDFAGIVTETHADEATDKSTNEPTSSFHVGDAVYGMSHASRGGQWADYALVTTEECVRKPDNLSFAEAAALAGSALTADQALFVYGGLEDLSALSEVQRQQRQKKVLITGASGAVGMYVVQFAVAAGHHVVAATSSRERNGAYLRDIGAHEVIEYAEFGDRKDDFDLVVDGVGGQVLEECWAVVRPGGVLVTIDSLSWAFVDEHRAKGVDKGKEDVRALFFIVEPSRESMVRISKHVEASRVRGQVLKTVPLDEAREAYESVHEKGAHSRGTARGKVVVVP